MASFEFEIGYIEAETVAYQLIQGYGIGPKFLGHISEEGRVIGFLLEKIADARHATPADFEACSQALSKLHNIGYLHGDANKHNFLITSDGVSMVDFESTTKSKDEAEFQKEVRTLKEQLHDTSGRGGRVVLAGPTAQDANASQANGIEMIVGVGAVNGGEDAVPEKAGVEGQQDVKPGNVNPG